MTAFRRWGAEVARLALPIVLAGVLFVLLFATLALLGLPAASSSLLILEGAVGDKFGLARTLVLATPLVIAGLGIALAWRAGMYNIGGEGQYISGGLAAGALVQLVPGGGWALMFMMLAAGFAGGAFYGWIAGWLHVRRGVQLVVSTILLNFVALQLLSWAVTGPLQETSRSLPQSAPVPASAMLPRFDSQTDLHAGVLLALFAAIAVQVFLWRTPAGFELRFVGASPGAARANRIPWQRVQERAMILSGGLCGFAGAVQLAGVQRELSMSFAENWGFIAIPVALLGGLSPLGIVAAGLYFGALLAGSKNLERFTPGAGAIVYVIQGLAVLALVAFQVWRSRRREARVD